MIKITVCYYYKWDILLLEIRLGSANNLDESNHLYLWHFVCHKSTIQEESILSNLLLAVKHAEQSPRETDKQ